VSVALGGNLEDFGIAEVFQLIGQQSKTGVLEIADGGRKMRLAFDAGAVVWASPAGATEHAALGETLVRCGMLTRDSLAQLLHESQTSARSLPALLCSSALLSDRELEEMTDLLTRETLFEVLRWSGGSFHFKAQPVVHDRPPEQLLGAEQILMDGLRMVDEWQTFLEDVPGDDAVFQRTGRFDVYRQKAHGDARARLADAERIFQLVDGRLSVRRIVDLSRLGTFDATRILADLRRSGVIEPLVSRRSPARQNTAKRSIPLAQELRVWLAAALPLAVLALAVWQLGERSDPAAAFDGTFPIVHRPMLSARDDFEKRRLHHVLEAHRFLWGGWPEDLSQVDRTGWLEGRVLAPSRARTYYYAQREDGLVLLGPRR